MGTIARMFKPLASLKLTVWLLALSMFLVLAGTLAQVHEGVWTVVDKYFRSLYVVIPLQLFVSERVLRVPLALPFPGGLTLGVLLFVNLIAAHITRFKFQAKRAGIIVMHLGVILLLVGEFVTGIAAEEGNMTIYEGQSSNYVEDIRASELALIDRSGASEDRVVVVPQSLLVHSARTGEAVEHAALPVSVSVMEWMYNSRLVGPMEQVPGLGNNKATAGFGLQIRAAGIARATGVDGMNTDIPSAYVALSAGGKDLGTHLVSLHFDEENIEPQFVDLNGKRYELWLRFKRTYKPYSLELIDFRHDKFVGTNTPRNFSSDVRLIDPTRNTDKEVHIRMNEPLRHAGETFYQAAFKQGDTGTVLQVVDNPGWLIPYISCSMVTLGMLIHFGVRIAASVRRLAA